MADLLQVLVLMAAPAAAFATMGYFNRRAAREFDVARSLGRDDPRAPGGASSR